MKARVFISTVVFVLIAIFSTSVQAVIIPLSNQSSEPNIPASWLDASMNLNVHNGAQWALTVEVSNHTPENAGDFAFKISEIYFNTSAPISDLTLVAVSAGLLSDWELTLDMDNIKADGFGYYDISIISTNINSVWIDPLETITFGILIDPGTGPYADTDFFALSAGKILEDHIFAYGAAKFVKTGEPFDLSAYGAYVPEPASIIMLGFGALVLLRRRRD